MAITDVDILSFISQFPIDKIAEVNSISVYNPGPSYDSEDLARAKIITAQKAHSVGRPCFIRARYRIDGGTWQDMNTASYYQFVIINFGVQLTNRIGQISIGCDGSNVYVRTANGHHSDVSGYGPFTYAPYGHTYEIQYVLYEMT